MNTNNDIPTIGELLERNRINGAKVIAVVLLVAGIAIGAVYTGIHNFNLFSRTLPEDQRLFALVPVILIEGGIFLMLLGSFVWFADPKQKMVGMVVGWSLFIIVALNTLVDSLIATKDTFPDWLHVYSTFIMYAMPVVVMAAFKLILDLDPAKRGLEIRKSIEHGLQEAKYLAAQKALMSEANRRALTFFGEAYGEALARHIRDSAPQVTITKPDDELPGSAPTVTYADDAPALEDSDSRPGAGSPDHSKSGDRDK